MRLWILASSALVVASGAVALQQRGLEMVPPGAEAPAFALPGADGKTHSLVANKGKWVVLEWTNRGCPYVVRQYQGSMQETQKQAKAMGAVWYSVISSAPGKQGFVTAEQAKEHYESVGSLADAVLFDSDGGVGRAYGARTTPQMVIVSPEGKVVYHGAIDDSPNPGPGTTVNNYVLAALNEAQAGKAVTTPTSRPYGCGVKY